MMISMWLYGLSRWFKQRFGSKKRTSIDPPLIQILPQVPEYRKPFTIREQIQGMKDAKLPTPEQIAENVASHGDIGLAFNDVFRDTLINLTTEDEQRALYLNPESFAQFDTALRRICKEKGIEVVTSTNQSLPIFMRITFRKLKG